MRHLHSTPANGTTPRRDALHASHTTAATIGTDALHASPNRLHQFLRRIQCVSTAIIMVIMATAVHAQTPVLKWEYRHNGPGNQNDRFNDLKVDAQLNAYVTGYRMGQTTNYDYMTAKVDNDGNQQWLTPYNGPANGLDEAYKLVMDNAGAVYVTGKSLGDGTGFDWATIKYNNSGVEQWATRFNLAAANVDEFPSTVILNANGNPLVTGVMPTPSGPPAPYTGLGMICYEYSALTGQFVADQTPQTENSSGIGHLYTIPIGTALRNDGTILFARENYQTNQGQGTQGSSRITLRKTPIGPVPTASAVYPPSSQALSTPDLNKPHGIIVDASGDSYIFGYTDIVYGGGENIQAIVIKHNELQEQWTTPAIFGGAGTGRDEALDAKEYLGDIYVVGYADMDATAGVDNDFLIAKINGSTGAVTWQQTYDRGNDDRAMKVHVDSLGNIYVVGQTVNASGNKDITLAMFNNSGQLQWEKHYNGPGNGDDIPTGLHVSTDANDITISGHSVGSGSQEDAIVLRYCTPPIPDAGPDKGFCSGGSTTIGSAALPNHTYLWTPATGLSSATVAQPTLTLTNSTNCPVNHQYIVKVTRQGGCFDFDTVNVTVYHNPTVSIAASQPNPVCQGAGTITLTPNVNTGCSGTPSYAWKLGTQTVNTSASAYSVSEVNQSGSYTLEVTNDYGGTSCVTPSNAITATVNPLPVGSASGANVCSNGSTNIALNGGTSYTWTSAETSGNVSGHSGGSGDTIQQTLVGEGTVTYTVIPSALGCEGQPFTVTATVAASLPQPDILANGQTVSGPVDVCAGEDVTLTTPMTGTYQWSCGGNGQSITLTPTQNMTCTLTVTQGTCSATSVPVQLVVNAAPTVSITGSSSLCAGSSTQLTANATPGSTLLWSGPGVDDETTPSVTANLAGNYTVTATNNGCSTTSSTFTVTEAAVPTVPTVTANGPLQFCQGEDVLLSVSNTSGCIGCNYTWSPSGSTPTEATTTVTQVGCYTVTATNDCGTQVSQAVCVTVNPLPVADAGPNPASISPGQSVQLNGSASGGSGGGYEYSWSPATTPPDAAVTSASPSVTTDYTLTVTDGNGCTDTDVVTVTVGPEPGDCDNAEFSTYQDTLNIHNCGASPAVIGISAWQPQQTGCTWEVNAVGDCGWIHNLQPVGPQLSSGSIIFDVDPNDSETMRTCSLVVTVGTVERPPIIVNQVGGCGVSIEESADGEGALVIAPNPTSGQFDILLPSVQGQHRYEVFSPMGQLIRSGTITSERTAIDMQGTAAGIYSLRVVDESGKMVGVKRIVVQ